MNKLTDCGQHDYIQNSATVLNERLRYLFYILQELIKKSRQMI